jgi:hypothetical protein
MKVTWSIRSEKCQYSQSFEGELPDIGVRALAKRFNELLDEAEQIKERQSVKIYEDFRNECIHWENKECLGEHCCLECRNEP